MNANSEKNAIEVMAVSKNFRLPQEGSNTLKSAFTRLFKSKSKSNKTQHALKNISFEVKKGEFYGIVGRNGSGKSTLLKMLAGIYQPTTGSVNVRGKLVPFIELGVGFNPELTGRENVYLNGAMLGFSKKEIDAFYPSIASFAEIERFMDQKLKNYSSGMQVRLAFSLAIRANAEILLVDEVLAVGDTDFQRKCFDYFRELKRTKTTVIFVSHDMSAVREYCDKALLIDKSKIVKIGAPDEIAKMYSSLFMEGGNTVQTQNGSKKRFGSQEIVVDSVKVEERVLRADKHETLSITMTVKALKTVDNSISIGFLVKNATSAAVLGMNTHELRTPIGVIGLGESRTLKWVIPNIFGDGKYTVDAAVTSSDGTTTYDWREDVTGFRAYREEYSPYIVTPTIVVEVL